MAPLCRQEQKTRTKTQYPPIFHVCPYGSQKCIHQGLNDDDADTDWNNDYDDDDSYFNLKRMKANHIIPP